MNLENFHKYLENPSLLYQVSYQELKSLVLQYPFSPNLHLLLLIKSIQEKHKDQDRHLAMVAISAPDRRKLWQLVNEVTQTAGEQEHFQLTEDFLELKDLSSLSFQLATAEEEQELTPLTQFIAATPDEGEQEAESPLAISFDFTASLNDEPGSVDETWDVALQNRPAQADFIPETGAEEHSPEIAGEAPSAPGELILAEAEADSVEAMPPAAELPQEDVVSTRGNDLAVPGPANEQSGVSDKLLDAPQVSPAPIPKSNFSSWQHSTRLGLHPLNPRQLVAAHRQKKEPIQPIHDAEQGDETGEAQHLAEKSVRSDTGIASETLARVLELQRHYPKAIAMYEQLVLQNPEKKAFFAAKIEELKSKM
jgi:hypothetical protein